MNNEICEILTKYGVLFKQLNTLDFSQYSKKRSYKLLLGVDLKDYFTAVFFRDAKSKFLRLELENLNEICAKLEAQNGTAIKKRVLFYNSQICSKVKAAQMWKFYDFM